jgi:hypothetical protein
MSVFSLCRERALEATVDKSASHQSNAEGAMDISQSVDSIKVYL